MCLFLFNRNKIFTLEYFLIYGKGAEMIIDFPHKSALLPSIINISCEDATFAVTKEPTLCIAIN